MFNLYSVQDDDSKVLLGSYADHGSAEAAKTDDSLVYSLEQWDGCFATVLY